MASRDRPGTPDEEGQAHTVGCRSAGRASPRTVCELPPGAATSTGQHMRPPSAKPPAVRGFFLLLVLSSSCARAIPPTGWPKAASCSIAPFLRFPLHLPNGEGVYTEPRSLSGNSKQLLLLGDRTLTFSPRE